MTALHPQHPLILTLTLDKSTHTFLTSLRSKYFPPSRNHLSAHITLFHAIPPHRFPLLNTELESICQTTNGWDVFIGEPSKMGNRGVMVFARERPPKSVERIHQQLLTVLKKGVEEERDRLTNQDLIPLRKPHVTVLNKAKDETEVEKCLEEVQAVFEGMKGDGHQFGQKVGRAVGFELWEYLGGPWKPLKAYWLQGEERHGEE